MTKFIAWLGSVLSSDNSASFGRFASLLSLVSCLTWDSAYVVFVMKHYAAFHFAPSDLLAYGGILLAQGGFCTMFYGASKGLEVLRGGLERRDQDGQRQ